MFKLQPKTIEKIEEVTRATGLSADEVIVTCLSAVADNDSTQDLDWRKI